MRGSGFARGGRGQAGRGRPGEQQWPGARPPCGAVGSECPPAHGGGRWVGLRPVLSGPDTVTTRQGHGGLASGPGAHVPTGDLQPPRKLRHPRPCVEQPPARVRRWPLRLEHVLKVREELRRAVLASRGGCDTLPYTLAHSRAHDSHSAGGEETETGSSGRRSGCQRPSAPGRGGRPPIPFLAFPVRCCAACTWLSSSSSRTASGWPPRCCPARCARVCPCVPSPAAPPARTLRLCRDGPGQGPSSGSTSQSVLKVSFAIQGNSHRLYRLELLR